MKPTKENQSYENNDESIYYGFHSSMMIFEKRPKDIRKVYVLNELTSKVATLLKYCSKNKVAYKIVNPKALESVSGSVHTEGICIIAKNKKITSQDEFIRSLSSKKLKNQTLVLLDTVKNPHNIGAIARTMAHFGSATLLVDKAELPSFSGANYRIAEGGYEYIDIVAYENIDKLAHKLKTNDFKIIGTSSHTENKLYSFKFPDKAVIVVGNEVKGMSKKFKSVCDEMVLIPGTGNVESLNVSLALGLMLGENYRQN